MVESKTAFLSGRLNGTKTLAITPLKSVAIVTFGIVHKKSALSVVNLQKNGTISERQYQ